MSLRRGLQAVVNVLRRRVQQQANQHFQSARQHPDGISPTSGSVIQQSTGQIRGKVSGIATNRHPEIYQQVQTKWASRASHFWKSTTRARFSQANWNRFPSFNRPALPLLFGFAAVGFVENRSRFDSANVYDEERHTFQLDLETATSLVRSIFREHDGMPDGKHPTDPSTQSYPTEIDGYILADRILAKGTEGVVYAAKLPEDHRQVVNENTAEDSSCHGDADRAIISDRRTVLVAKDDQEQAGCVQEEHCNLAVKMLFNYNIGSTPAHIVNQFKAEQLPLLIVQGKFGESYDKKRKKLGTEHPNIVQMYQSFVDCVSVPNVEDAMGLFDVALPRRLNICGAGADTTMYVVMKRYKMSLRDYVTANGPSDSYTAMVIVAQMLEGVGYLVSHRVAHGDLKSNNILVDTPSEGGSPHVVLADFGCAVEYQGHELSDCVTMEDRNRQGNSALMAPELKQAHTTNTLRYCDYLQSDEWAIGAIAYEICGQRNPFYSTKKGPGLDSQTYQEQDLPELQTQSIGLELVVQMLLQRNPIKRPAPHVAADILHLFLWQPSVLGMLMLCQGHSTPDTELTTWLLQVVMTYTLSKRSLIGQPRSVRDRDMPQTSAEHSLFKTFMKRADSHNLNKAVGYIVARFQWIFTTQMPPRVECEAASDPAVSGVRPCPIPTLA